MTSQILDQLQVVEWCIVGGDKVEDVPCLHSGVEVSCVPV